MPQNSFPTFPSQPTPQQLVDKFFLKENKHSFIESFDLKITNVFLFSGTFKVQRVYNTQAAIGDENGHHFFGSESYDQGGQTYYHTVWLTYLKEDDEFIGAYNDDGPDGIFFNFKAAAPEPEAFYTDFNNLIVEPAEENGFVGGAVEIINPVYRTINPSIYNFSFSANLFGLGAAAPQQPPLLINVSPSNPLALQYGDGIIVTHQGGYITVNEDPFLLMLAYGVPDTEFVGLDANNNIQDHPPQWFLREVDQSDNSVINYFLDSSIFGNGNPDLFKFDAGSYTPEGFNEVGWDLALVV